MFVPIGEYEVAAGRVREYLAEGNEVSVWIDGWTDDDGEPTILTGESARRFLLRAQHLIGNEEVGEWLQ